MSAVPATLIREANALREAGRLAEAEAAYLRILGRWPSLPDCWFNLGVVQRRSGRFEAALASYQQALTHGITAPEEVHLNRAVIYSDCLRQDAAAERELREALTLNPAYVPALLNLANLHEDRGLRDEARALYGRALDAAGDYRGAFAAYQAANRHSRLSALPAPAHYDRSAQEQMTERLIAAPLPPPLPAAAQGVRPRPIFICGMFRSGSTLTEQLIAAHPGVTAGGELDLLPSLIARLQPYPECLASAS